MARKERLEKMEMPAPESAKDEMLELDEMELEADFEDEEGMDEESPLADISDDELIEEMKLRGLELDSADEDMEAEEMDYQEEDMDLELEA